MCSIIHADGSPLDTTDCLLDSEYVLRQSIVIVHFLLEEAAKSMLVEYGERGIRRGKSKM